LMEKKEGQKSRGTIPLSALSSWFLCDPSLFTFTLSLLSVYSVFVYVHSLRASRVFRLCWSSLSPCFLCITSLFTFTLLHGFLWIPSLFTFILSLISVYSVSVNVYVHSRTLLHVYSLFALPVLYVLFLCSFSSPTASWALPLSCFLFMFLVFLLRVYSLSLSTSSSFPLFSYPT
jgi:hypothetical protein